MISTVTFVIDEEYETNRVSQLKEEGANFVPDGTGPKVYVVTCKNASDWNEIHDYIINENEIDGIPNRKIECTDDCKICDRMASYEMSDAEADQLKLHSKVASVHLDPDYYQGTFRGVYDRPLSTTPRYDSNVKIGRDFDSNFFPTTPTADFLGRTGASIYRHQERVDRWFDIPDTTIIESNPTYLGDGSDVDVIVCDESGWYGHVEFVKTGVGEPTYFVGDNVLKSGFATSSQNGVCGVLDCVLDMPYYLDPDWFEGDASSRLMVRWDGTVVPVESYARDWWNNNSTSSRSSKYVSPANGGTATGNNDFGTVTISADYTRARMNGSNTAEHTNSGYHATPCMSQAYGKTAGWAFNANKWHMGIIWGTGAVTVSSCFKIIKIFHQCKPNRSLDNTKNPTITSHSWGRRLDVSIGYGANYFYRKSGNGNDGVPYDASSIPEYLKYVTGGFAVPAPPAYSETLLGDDMVNAGVIFVSASGNYNQQQVLGDHPNYNNYLGNPGWTLQDALTLLGFLGVTTLTNRPGFPASIGIDSSGSTDIFRTFNIGNLASPKPNNTTEQKADGIATLSASCMGNAIDCYTIGADSFAGVDKNWFRTNFNRYDGYYTLDGVQSLDSEDGEFGGTSSACPVTVGLFATKLQHNRTWTWSDIKDWLANQVTVADADEFPEGTEAITANDSNWNSRTNLQGSLRRILWDAPVSSPTPPGPEPDPDDPTALSPGILLLAQAGGGLLFRPGNGMSIKKLT